MKKETFEKEVRKHLKELQKLYKKFAPKDASMLSIGVDRDYYNAFILRTSENGEAIENAYILQISHFDEE